MDGSKYKQGRNELMFGKWELEGLFQWGHLCLKDKTALNLTHSSLISSTCGVISFYKNLVTSNIYTKYIKPTWWTVLILKPQTISWCAGKPSVADSQTSGSYLEKWLVAQVMFSWRGEKDSRWEVIENQLIGLVNTYSTSVVTTYNVNGSFRCEY